MSNFKIALTSIFAVSLVVGIILFAMYKAGAGQTTYEITVWGVISEEAFNAAYKASTISKDKFTVVNYVKKNVNNFDSNFVEALAESRGPDVVILPDDSIYKNRNKLLTIPFSSYPERTFKDQFVQGAEIFIKGDGISAVPLAIDPLVMYWNRDIFGNNLVVFPPKYWDEFYDLVNKMTKRDNSTNIMQSTIALGGWSNITNAKDIISLLFLQAGTPIVSYDRKTYTSVISDQLGQKIIPGQSALDFYTQFSNPTSASYSWNRSLPTSQNFFLSGNQAVYLGFSSEIFSIQQKNPNLNFDVANVPQVRQAKTKIGFARMYGMAIVKQSKVVSPAFRVIIALTEPSSQTALEKVTNLPPIRRDLLANKPTDAFRSIFYDSALISRTWVDPDNTITTNAFRDMIESITSGRSSVTESLNNLNQIIGGLFSK